MFGHQDINDQTTRQPGAPLGGASAVASAPAVPGNAPGVEPSEVDEALKALAAHDGPDVEPAPTPVINNTPPAASPAPSPSVNSQPSASESPADVPHDLTPAPSNDVETSQLLDLKQSALQQLTPLIDKLDQTPEERFRTSMMMIQAADNRSLLPKAYEAAQQIPDEKVKAQALLDVVNEINYFTQPHESEA